MNYLNDKKTKLISRIIIVLTIVLVGGVSIFSWHKLRQTKSYTIALSTPCELLTITESWQTQGNLIPTNQTKMPNDVDQIEVKTTLKSADNVSLLLELNNPVLTLTDETKAKLNNEESTKIEALLKNALTAKHSWFDGATTQTYNSNNKPTLKGQMQISTFISLDSMILEQKHNEEAFKLLKEKAPSVIFCIAMSYDGTQQ